MRELTAAGAIVFLAAGSDYFVKHIVDECVYLDKEFDIDGLKKVYQELFHNADWIHLKRNSDSLITEKGMAIVPYPFFVNIGRTSG